MKNIMYHLPWSHSSLCCHIPPSHCSWWRRGHSGHQSIGWLHPSGRYRSRRPMKYQPMLHTSLFYISFLQTGKNGWRLRSTNLIVGPESSFTSVWASRCSTTSWSSNSSVWGCQAEGTAISSKPHPQLLHRGSLDPPVLHGVVLQTLLAGAEVQWNQPV